jgi:hypothetical protein
VSTVEGGLGKRRVELKQVEALIEMEREQQAMLIMRITQELDDQVRRLRTQSIWLLFGLLLVLCPVLCPVLSCLTGLCLRCALCCYYLTVCYCGNMIICNTALSCYRIVSQAGQATAVQRSSSSSSRL